MVKFFGRTAKTATKTTKTAGSTTAASTAAKSATTTPASRAAATVSEPVVSTTPAAKTTTRRRTTSTTTANGDKPSTVRRGRPPRKDWAAEAADTPTGTPLPTPSSLATAPGEDDGAGTTATKRRRGTRGGRGRKRAGTVDMPGENGVEPAEAVPSTTRGRRDLRQKPPAPPATIEEALALQAAALDRFTTEMSATVQRLQESIEDLRERDGNRATSNPRVAIFVDVPNLIYAAERRKVNLDFGKILEHFTKGRELVRASAYAPITDDPQARFENQRFVQSFVGQPYRIITKPLKRFADGSMKANFDIELAIDILTMSDRLDIVVLMSGDGDFRRVVELIGSRGVRVEIVAFAETAASELKSVADLYVDLGAHVDKFKVSR